MFELTLIRHAKSSWNQPALSDIERPLNERGRANAPLMGSVLKQRGIGFDLMISSPARRAATTAELLAGAIGYDTTAIETEPQLYDASLASLLAVVQALPANLQRVALIAHNPGLSELCDYLCEGAPGDLPTCAVAGIGFHLDDWRAVYRGTGTLIYYEYPRKYTDPGRDV